MSTEVQITFLRHGRSQADDDDIHEGRYDSPLTNVGRSQVQTRGQEFLARALHFDLILASPLQRAAETAAIIGQCLGNGIPSEIDADWMEFNNGPLAGLPMQIAAERYPKPAFRNPYEPFLSTGESDWEIYCRAVRAVEKLVRRGPGQYLVVAHGGILNSAMRVIVGAQPPTNGHGMYFGFGFTGYARLTYAPAGHQWRLWEFCAGVV